MQSYGCIPECIPVLRDGQSHDGILRVRTNHLFLKSRYLATDWHGFSTKKAERQKFQKAVPFKRPSSFSIHNFRGKKNCQKNSWVFGGTSHGTFQYCERIRPPCNLEWYEKKKKRSWQNSFPWNSSSSYATWRIFIRCLMLLYGSLSMWQGISSAAGRHSSLSYCCKCRWDFFYRDTLYAGSVFAGTLAAKKL